MNKLGIGGVVIAISLVALLAVSAAWAQGATPSSEATPQSPLATPQPPSQAMPQPQDGPPGRGPGGAFDGMSDIAKLLDMTPDQIWAERVQGKTLADLAKEKSVDTQTLVDALVASQKTMLDQSVADERLTQAQADKWLEWYKQAAALQLTEPYGPGFGGLPGGMRGGPGGPGGMHGPGPGDQNGNTPPQPAPTPTQ